MLEVNHLCKSYKSGSITYPVLEDISFTVEKGDFTAIMGPSGSGKTTLLNCISCFIPFDKGTITLGNQSIADLSEEKLAETRNKQLGFVFQDFMLFDGLNIFENICVPQIIKGGQAAQMENKARSFCSMFGIEKIMEKYPAEISGGEKQRTAIARALMNDPSVLLADEPTGNLDSKSRDAVIEAFQMAGKELNATIFMVTHDSYVASFCDRVIILKDGSIFKEVQRTGDRESFMDELLETMKEMGGIRHEDA